jgi:hypothetical protein
MGGVSAQSVSPPAPTPVPPPGSGPPPPKVGPALGIGSSGGDFFNFQFVDAVYGYGFNPGEQVTITSNRASITPVTVTVEQNGTFSHLFSYQWVFCGPKGKTEPPPLFTAVGDQGSRAQAQRSPENCPELVSNEKSAIQPGTGSGIVGSGTAVSATAVAGTALVITPAPHATPIQVGHSLTPQANPSPEPAPLPRPVTFSVQGFGFAPTEKVEVREEQAGPYGHGPAVEAQADGMGRFKTEVKVYLPPLCQGWNPAPVLSAMGDRGASVVSPLRWIRPLIACPVRGAPVPGSGPPPPVPGPLERQSGASSLSLRLVPWRVRSGKTERAIVHGEGPSILLSVSYPNHGVKRLIAHLSKHGPLTFAWRIPKPMRKGLALVTVKVNALGPSARAVLRIR